MASTCSMTIRRGRSRNNCNVAGRESSCILFHNRLALRRKYTASSFNSNLAFSSTAAKSSEQLANQVSE